MKKEIVISIVSLFAAFTLTACGGNTTDNEKKDTHSSTEENMPMDHSMMAHSSSG